MLLTAAARRDSDTRCSRDRAVDPDAPRSVRERLEATVSGLGELELLRQRQEVLVRAALEAEQRREEKLLEENILLLRKQLNCLRRRDAGLISQLQELDRQLCDLHLDASQDGPETDSRPSSGFFELSEVSGSLSNSSNSVFSECWCSSVDADGRLRSTDELSSCLECERLGGVAADASSASVRRSSSAPHPPPPDSTFGDSQVKFHVVSRSGDVFRFRSPLHAVTVQNPVFLQNPGGGSRDEGLLKKVEAGGEALFSAPSSSSSSSLSHKRVERYIYSLLQRRAPPSRTIRPRTSISTEPSKSLQAGLSVRQVPGSGSGAGSGPWTGSEAVAPSQDVHSVAPADPKTQNCSDLCSGSQTFCSGLGADTGTNILLKQKTKKQRPSAAPPAPPADGRPLGSPTPTSWDLPDQRLVSKGPKLPPISHSEPRRRSGAELAGLGSSTQSQDGGAGVNHILKLSRGVSRTASGKTRASRLYEPAGDHRSSSRKSHKASKRVTGGAASTNIQRLPPSIPEGRVLQKHHHHHHGNHSRDQVIAAAKPRHKRDEAFRRVPRDEAFRRVPRDEAFRRVPRDEAFRRVPRDEAFRRAAPRRTKERPAPRSSPDTSEDEESNYTTNRFGDHESSQDESSRTSETEEGGGRNRPGRAAAGATGQETKAFVKIKASHNLKRKIMRFRSGSLKLMTTV